MPDKTQATKVTYQTFVDDLSADIIESANLYSTGDVDFTYTTKSNEIRSVKIPYDTSENSLLIHSLKSKSIEYVAHDSEYPHSDKSDMQFVQWSSFAIFLIPLLLIGIVFYQAKLIAKLSNSLAKTKSTGSEIDL